MTTATSRSISAAIDILRSHSLAALVQEQLESRILAGDILPGDKLAETEVAAEFRVSRGPVREAFRALEEAGLLRTEKNRGVFVRQVSLAEAEEIYEVRGGMDRLIGQLAASRANPGEIAELRRMVEQMRAAAQARSVADYYPLNIRFHDRLAQLSGNATLLATYRRLVNELHLYRRKTLQLGEDAFPASTSEHAAIVEAIASRDPETAGRLLYEHVCKSRARLGTALASEGARLPPALIRGDFRK